MQNDLDNLVANDRYEEDARMSGSRTKLILVSGLSC